MSQSCNICGDKLINWFHKTIDPLSKEKFSIFKCTKCGLGHTFPQPKNPSRYYDRIYYGNRHSFTNKYCIKRRLGFIASAMNKADKETGRKLLDIGCGDGSFLLGAREAGWDVMGTEINSGLARTTNLDVREKIEQVYGFAPFDCITMWHSLEHMSDIKATLSQLSKLLKPNGKLIIAVPDNGGLQSKVFRHKWLHLDVPRHLYHFDATSLSFCLKHTGFRIEHQWHQELEYDLIGWSQSTLNCFSSTPNTFLNFITGKHRQKNLSMRLNISSFVLGSILTVLFLPSVAVGTRFRRGGTLITAACRAT